MKRGYKCLDNGSPEEIEPQGRKYHSKFFGNFQTRIRLDNGPMIITDQLIKSKMSVFSAKIVYYEGIHFGLLAIPESLIK